MINLLVRLGRDRTGRLAAAALVLLLLAALVGPLLTSFGFDEINKPDRWVAPLSAGHLLGADWLGRDLLARLLTGLRVSLIVGLAGTSAALVIGVVVGVVAGYFGGWVDALLMRAVDILYALPFIIFVILLTVTFGNSLAIILVAIASVEWLTIARVVRGQTLSLKQREYIEAAQVIGVSTPAIMVRHIIPNMVGPVAAFMTLSIPNVILAESFLSFFGLGIQEPLASLGTLMSQGTNQMEIAPWMLIFPALTMVLVLGTFNLLGEAMRRAAGTEATR